MSEQVLCIAPPPAIFQTTDCPEMSHMRHTHTQHPGGVGLSNESMSQGRQVRSSTSYREPKITEWASVWRRAQTESQRYCTCSVRGNLASAPPLENDKSRVLEMQSSTVYVFSLPDFSH